MNSIRNQSGSTLLVSLVMLVLLTLIAISAMSSTTINIQIVGNAQFKEEANAAGQRAIETVLSDGNFKTTPPAPQNIDINLDGAPDYTVTFEPAPACTSYLNASPSDPSVPLECAGSSGLGIICYWTLWDITAKVTDANTGAEVVIHQGVRTIAGLNAAVNACGV